MIRGSLRGNYVWQVIDMSSFKDVVGHKNIIKYIQNAVTADAVSHAYILNGERGSGKKLLANLFAMSLQCQTGTKTEMHAGSASRADRLSAATSRILSGLPTRSPIRSAWTISVCR